MAEWVRQPFQEQLIFLYTLIDIARVMNRHFGYMGELYLASDTQKQDEDKLNILAKENGITSIYWMRPKLFLSHKHLCHQQQRAHILNF